MENNDIGNVIGKLLEDPETLSRLMSVAGGIMEGMKQSEGQADGTVAEKISTEKPTEQSNSEAAVAAVSDGKAPSGADTAKLLASLMSGMKPKANDPRCALLYALKPYMSKQRAESIDTLVKALGVSELASGFFRTGGSIL